MTDEYLSMKIDVGLLLKKVEQWKANQVRGFQQDENIILNVSMNKDRTKDSQPLYRGKNISVWHNVKEESNEEKV